MALEPLHDAHERERTRGLVAMNAAYGHQHRPRLSMRDPADDASSWEWCGQANVNMAVASTPTERYPNGRAPTQYDNRPGGFQRVSKTKKYLTLFLLLLFSAFLLGCDDEAATTTPTAPSSTTPADSPSLPTGLVRAAQLSEDARTVDVRLTSTKGVFDLRDLSYPGVSGYIELDIGQYRVQFFPAGGPEIALTETTANLGSGQTLTFAIVGLDAFQVATIRDDLQGVPGRGRVKLVNAVPDYPAPFDLRVLNGQLLFSDVGYLQSSDYSALIAGVYDFGLLRSGTDDRVAAGLNNNLPSGTTSTVFAIGALRRNDIELFRTRDSLP